MILLEAFTQDDWLSIAEESDAYGFMPLFLSEKWVPKRGLQGGKRRRVQRVQLNRFPSSKGNEHRDH